MLFSSFVVLEFFDMSLGTVLAFIYPGLVSYKTQSANVMSAKDSVKCDNFPGFNKLQAEVVLVTFIILSLICLSTTN